MLGPWARNAHWCLLTNFSLLSPELMGDPGDHSHRWLPPFPMAPLRGLGEGGGTQEERTLPQGCRSSHWDCAVRWVGAGWLEGVGDLCGC